ncbi:hypothetical protein JTB14_024781 [Gonioctena quinquepunctata]|nr:hypothetical protein JTB14_024781 [Gonioctena quinquepunctata]
MEHMVRQVQRFYKNPRVERMENTREGKNIPGKLKKGSENSGTPLVRGERGIWRKTWEKIEESQQLSEKKGTPLVRKEIGVQTDMGKTIEESKQITENKETSLDRQEMGTQTEEQVEIGENLADRKEQGNEEPSWVDLVPTINEKLEDGNLQNHAQNEKKQGEAEERTNSWKSSGFDASSGLKENIPESMQVIEAIRARLKEVDITEQKSDDRKALEDIGELNHAEMEIQRDEVEKEKNSTRKEIQDEQNHPGNNGSAIEKINLDQIKARKEETRQKVEQFTGINADSEFQELFVEALNLVLEIDGLEDATDIDFHQEN